MGGPRGPSVDHTPQTPADDRALRLLEHADMPAPRKTAILETVKAVQEEAAKQGKELQAEFGPQHVALIVGCNQFVRFWRSGPEPGAVELLLDPTSKTKLNEAGFALRDPEGAVFKLFGWVRLDADAGALGALQEATRQAFVKATKK